MIHVVTIKEKIQLYKGEEPANAIELLSLSELGYELVSAKDRFQIGDKALLVEPDYNLPDTDFWKDWTAPGGDPKKSKLGSHNRIRAVKFNLHRGDGMPVYSNGILLTIGEVLPFIETFNNRSINKKLQEFGVDLTLELNDLEYLSKSLGIYKYEAPERNQGGTGKAGASREFPQGLYKTDEVNFNKVNWTFPIHLVGQTKLDGSSITLYVRNGKAGICSRNLEKPITYLKKTGFKHGLWYKFLSYFGYDRGIYTEVESESEFVKVGKPYLDKLVEYCKFHRLNIALRGELIGKGASNGSGNKNNPHANVEPQIVFFGADVYDKTAERMDFLSFASLIGDLGSVNPDKELTGSKGFQSLQFKHPDIVFDKLFETREDLLKACEDYFSKNMIEGIVVRTLDGKFSAKCMNLEYDARK